MRIFRPVYDTTVALQDTVRDLGRLREVAAVLVRHGMGALIHEFKVPGFRLAATSMQTTPARVVAAIQELGPTFVKFGQLMSTRVDILPAQYIKALQQLQDDVAREPIRTADKQLTSLLGESWRDQIRDFSEEPLATGSIAQVHSATLADGQEVVVKILRPSIKERVEADISILNLLANRLLKEFPEATYFDPHGILKEFKRSIEQEMDLVLEARSAKIFASNFAESDEVVFPKVYQDLSGPEVLVMERLRGTRIRSAREAGVDMTRAGRNYLVVAYRMLFEHGFFHGDLHPGNVLVMDDGRLGLLDFGMVGRLTPEMKDNLVAILFALQRGDFRSIARIYYDLGRKTDRVDYESFERDVTEVMERNWADRTLEEINLGPFLKEVADGAMRYRIRAPAHYTMFFKALLTTEGLARSLVPEVDPVQEAAPFIRKLVGERFRPERLTEELYYHLLTLRSLERRIPGALAQLLDDVQQQRLRLEIIPQTTPEDRAASVRRNHLLVTVPATATSILAGALALQMDSPTLLGVPWLSAMFFMGAGLLWLWTMVVLFLDTKR